MIDVFKKQFDTANLFGESEFNLMVANRRSSCSDEELEAYKEYLSKKIGKAKKIYVLIQDNNHSLAQVEISYIWSDEIEKFLEDHKLSDNQTPGSDLPWFEKK